MIDFPITGLLDDSICTIWLERHLHPDGLKCRIVGARSDGSSGRKTTFRPIAVAPVKATTRC